MHWIVAHRLPIDIKLFTLILPKSLNPVNKNWSEDKGTPNINQKQS